MGDHDLVIGGGSQPLGQLDRVLGDLDPSTASRMVRNIGYLLSRYASSIA
jgi:hypothetical protein